MNCKIELHKELLTDNKGCPYCEINRQNNEITEYHRALYDTQQYLERLSKGRTTREDRINLRLKIELLIGKFN